MFFALLTLFLLSGCYPTIEGTVVDATTGKPIEGALVLVQWTKEHGFGDPYRTLYKVVETITDKHGYFTINGVYNPFVKPPEMIIYKTGYIPWRNDSIFPSIAVVKNYEWKNKATYKLEEFSDKYSYAQLSSFLEHPFYLMVHNKALQYDRIFDDISTKAYYENTKKVNVIN
jgi:hypothetical protein